MTAEAASRAAMEAREAATEAEGEPASEAVRRAREAALESLRYLHTGSQWVVLDRAFCHYLAKDERAMRWRKVFAARFLADESFVQTVLMHSPFASTNVNNNLRWRDSP